MAVGDLVCAVGVREVDLNHDEVGRVIEREWLDVFVNDDSVVVR